MQPFDVRSEGSLEERWRWKELEGLSGYGFRYATEGVDGDVWFARKEGVVRYDGFGVQSFDLEGVESAESVIDLHVSQNGAVYLLLDRYLAILRDGQWTVEEGAFSELSYGNAICEDAQGGVWIGVGSGVIRCGEDSNEFWDLGFELVCAAIVDTENRLWVADAESTKIEVFDIAASEQGPLTLRYEFHRDEGGSDWVKLLLTANGDVWVLAYDPGGRWFRYRNYERMVASERMGGGRFSWHQMGVAEAPAGRLWLSVGRNLAELSKERGFRVYDVEQYPIPTSYTYIVPLSGDRILIGGKASKIYTVDLSDSRWETYPQLIFQCEDKDGVHWFIEHGGGVVSHDPETEEWLLYSRNDEILDTPNRIFCASDGTLWASGNHEGVAAVSFRENGSWHRRVFPRAGEIFSHLAVLEAEDGSVVFGSGSQANYLEEGFGGAVVFRRDRGSYVGAHVGPPVYPKRTANLVERSGDGLWFGAMSLTRQTSGGLLAPEKIDLFDDNWIDHMIVDDANDLWVGSWGMGIYQYDGVDWTLHDEASGVGSNQVSYLYNGVNQKGIWAMTSKGLSRFDGRTWSNWDFPFNALFKRENDTMQESSDGSLWINYAYRSWFLEGVANEQRRPFFRTVRYRPDGVAPETSLKGEEKAYPEGSQIVLEWTGKDYWSDTAEEELEYSWRIGNQEWSAYSRDRSARLDNLQAGDYVFEVRARDRDWNVDATPSRMGIVVTPPLWKRPWFITLTISVFGLVVFLINALFKARVRTALAMEEFKLDFFTNISHELRNPLAVIVGPIESLLSREKSAESRSSLQLALRNARKMQGLINQLLQFRKIELGKSKYNPAHGEIVGFVKESVDSLLPLAEEKRQRLEYRPDPNYCECSYDADKLQKIVDNLVSNAIKYSPEGSTVSILMTVTEEPGHRECCMIVEDEGRGIPSHQIDLVLKPFYRAKRGAESGEGFGIGLAFVGQLVQLWGGEIILESPILENGKGTRATVRLPLVETGESEPLTLTGESTEFDDEDIPVVTESRARILVVEDNRDLRTFMRNELHSRFEVLEAENGRQGLELANKENPDLLISDVMMPEMDGLELCRKMRADRETSHIPIIILTARSSEEHTVEGIKAGADEYFAKPVNMIRLSARIENLLESRRRLKERFSQQLVVEPTELAVSSTDEAILRKAIEVVESRMKDESFDVDQFVTEMGMSRTTLYRKLKALTGQGPSPFIKTMRLKRAAQLLGSGKLKISEVLEHIGILDQSYFSRVFKKEFGVSPSAYAAEKAQQK
ncbi:hybrid sensor histidine kinase/response regulator transcription factor [Pelagicoccus mobilis]|uniref:hybrid sensor histidine kinase/response regulator transcription factor n=1 Tax=Pelagicoccus mobilis TaxID=415221 RepID=UPI001907472E|nr:hybrid sensor histidine kinase/response regulator transcription factor [Pelagicoccus mobilis]